MAGHRESVIRELTGTWLLQMMAVLNVEYQGSTVANLTFVTVNVGDTVKTGQDRLLHD